MSQVQCMHADRCTNPIASRWRYSVVAITTDSDLSHLLSVNPGSNPGSAFPFASTTASFETQVPFSASDFYKPKLWGKHNYKNHIKICGYLFNVRSSNTRPMNSSPLLEAT